MSKFKPVSAFQTESAPAPASAPASSPAVYQEPSPVATRPAAESALEVVFARNQERLQQSGADVGKLRQDVMRLSQSFDPRRSDGVHQLGSKSGEKIVQYSEKLLTQVKTKDMDGLGEKLHDVVMLAKGINVQALVKNSGSGSKIPLIGGLIDSLRMGKEQILGRYDTLSKQIEKLVSEIKVTQTRLSTRIRDLDQVYEFNVEEYRNLDCNILVGEIKVEELRQELEQRRNAPSATDPMEAQALGDLQDLIGRLDKRVHDLRTMQMVAVQTAPMIRMVQSNNRILIDKFHNLQELTIPSWKKQFTLAIALIEQQKAVELSQRIDDTTNDLMRRNADLLRQNSVNTARANQRSVVDIETLEHVQQTLISTMEEVEQIQREGEQSRQQAAGRMEEMKTELMQRLNGSPD
ncbi:MAG: toxic anion resistance protein [Fluviicoccus sp.]|uniref:toxic anion resistance protein n=1 Tax=Fluviicoccus sp. TaxID=2003552 RepID=UPI0027187AA2|nr:toxic anion resistance protein [Fluviicoccus sp.]MDO8329426.1 toxic anion resistance protein [Fluviicoccus sp.]